jgi:hypothetical protein
LHYSFRFFLPLFLHYSSLSILLHFFIFLYSTCSHLLLLSFLLYFLLPVVLSHSVFFFPFFKLSYPFLFYNLILFFLTASFILFITAFRHLFSSATHLCDLILTTVVDQCLEVSNVDCAQVRVWEGVCICYEKLTTSHV